MLVEIYGRVNQLYYYWNCTDISILKNEIYYDVMYEKNKDKKNKDKKIDIYNKHIESLNKTISLYKHTKIEIVYIIFSEPKGWKLKKKINYPYKLTKDDYFENFKIIKVDYLENKTVKCYIDEILEEIPLDDKTINELNEMKKNYINELELLVNELNTKVEELKKKRRFLIF